MKQTYDMLKLLKNVTDLLQKPKINMMLESYDFYVLKYTNWLEKDRTIVARFSWVVDCYFAKIEGIYTKLYFF